jgi:hypothetical protein
VSKNKQADFEIKELKKRLIIFEVALQEERLMPAEDVETAQRKLASEVKKHLLNVPTKYADQLLNLEKIRQAKAVLTEIVEDVLGVLATKSSHFKVVNPANRGCVLRR